MIDACQFLVNKGQFGSLSFLRVCCRAVSSAAQPGRLLSCRTDLAVQPIVRLHAAWWLSHWLILSDACVQQGSKPRQTVRTCPCVNRARVFFLTVSLGAGTLKVNSAVQPGNSGLDGTVSEHLTGHLTGHLTECQPVRTRKVLFAETRVNIKTWAVCVSRIGLYHLFTRIRLG